MNEEIKRPLGIIIVSILGFIGSIMFLGLSISDLLLRALRGVFFNITAWFFLIVSIISFVGFYGIWKMRRRGLYIATVVFSFMAILDFIPSNLGTLADLIFSVHRFLLIINLIMVVYLWMKRKLLT
jgi:uncharacterized membrane protein (DUF2068 family)